ncbi:MAG: flagellar basal body P-ring protein FlgI [Phycisphaeraceae bacterium]
MFQASLPPLRLTLVLFVTTLCLAGRAAAVQVQDIVRIKGAEGGKIVGSGLVVGLNGTGDGGDFLPAMRSLAQIIGRLVDPNVVAAELEDAENVALVTLTAQVPRTGCREGDRLDVHIASIGPAESLEGGRLFLIPMIGPTPDSPVFAFAEGAVTIENPDVPTTAVVEGGAEMVRDVRSRLTDEQGRITLVINDANASWQVSHNLASLINGLLSPDGPAIAKAEDEKNVVVQMPSHERQDPAAFISQILQTYLDPSQVGTGAKVVINERTGTIVMSGDVQISPVIISHEGLTITSIAPEPPATPADPQVEEQPFVAMDPGDRDSAKLADLLAAFNQLKIPAQDRIEILKLMHESGKLHAQLVIE